MKSITQQCIHLTLLMCTLLIGRGQSRGRRGGGTQRGQSSGSGWGGPPSPPPPPPGPSPSSNGCWNPSFPSSSAGHHSYPPSFQSNLAASSPIVSRVGMIGGGVGGVVCMCGEEAILLTVRNEQSANKGIKSIVKYITL